MQWGWQSKWLALLIGCDFLGFSDWSLAAAASSYWRRRWDATDNSMVRLIPKTNRRPLSTPHSPTPPSPLPQPTACATPWPAASSDDAYNQYEVPPLVLFMSTYDRYLAAGDEVQLDRRPLPSPLQRLAWYASKFEASGLKNDSAPWIVSDRLLLAEDRSYTSIFSDGLDDFLMPSFPRNLSQTVDLSCK